MRAKRAFFLKILDRMLASIAFFLKILLRKILDCMLASLAFCLKILLRKIPSGKGLNRLNSSSQMQVIAPIWPFLKVNLKKAVQTEWDVKWMSEFFDNSFHHFQVRTARDLKFRLSQDLSINFPRRLKITAQQFGSKNAVIFWGKSRLRVGRNAWEQLSLFADQSTPRTGAGLRGWRADQSELPEAWNLGYARVLWRRD